MVCAVIRSKPLANFPGSGAKTTVARRARHWPLMSRFYQPWSVCVGTSLTAQTSISVNVDGSRNLSELADDCPSIDVHVPSTPDVSALMLTVVAPSGSPEPANWTCSCAGRRTVISSVARLKRLHGRGDQSVYFVQPSLLPACNAECMDCMQCARSDTRQAEHACVLPEILFVV